MRLLLLRAVAPNERFGLGPFFRIEPLGLEYIAAAVRRDGHHVAIYDLRFVARQGRGGLLDRILRRERPDVVGIASAHTIDTNEGSKSRGAIHTVTALRGTTRFAVRNPLGSRRGNPDSSPPCRR